jgi:hypothetical protein
MTKQFLVCTLRKREEKKKKEKKRLWVMTTPPVEVTLLCGAGSHNKFISEDFYLAVGKFYGLYIQYNCIHISNGRNHIMVCASSF